jgi:hypothetical protein
MKNLTFLIVCILSVVLWSCGGGKSPEERAENMAKKAMERAGVDESEFNAMKGQLEEMAENAEKIAEEEAAETEEDKETFSEKNVKLLGLSITERKIQDQDWQKAIVLSEEYKKLSNEQLQELTHEKIEKMIMDAGFTDIEAAKSKLTDIADSRDVILSVMMDMGMLESTRIIDGDETYEKEMKELGEKINERAYSPDDLKAMDENVKISASITELLYRLNN